MPSRRLLLFSLAGLLLLLSLGLMARGCTPNREAQERDTPALAPTVLLISIDGFRADYLDRYDAPTLNRLADEGIRAEYMIPSFPTKTFPNHYTLVTGLYPEQHGIVANTMYDPVFDASFAIGDSAAVTDARWWGGEPIWVTVEKQGQKAGTYFWPGSEAAIQGIRPSYWTRYDGDIPGPQRVQDVLAWLDLPPAERPTFLTLYFSLVDHAGHEYGPDAPEVAEAVATVDHYMGLLVEGLEARNLLDEVNIIVVSDHGMAPTSPERVIPLDAYIDLDAVRVVDWSPVAALLPHPGEEEAVYEALKKASHLSVYRKDDIPERLHYQKHRRIMPIIAIADEGWSISTRAMQAENPERFLGGTHGYDNQAPSMRATFLARGPAFVTGETVGPFANIHVYNLMAAILGIEPAPNDGSLQAVRHLLKPGIAHP